MRQQANLRVRVLGVLGVAVDGHEVAPIELASRKGRTLLKLLLARRGAVVPAEVLVEALWGGRPPADPDANLATLVSRLRAVLGPDAIAGDRQGWRFVAGGRVEVDLDEAERLAGEAEARLAGEPALALAAAERALDLLGRGPFLADEPDADWALPPRREAERLAARARQLAWDAALALADHARALDHARAATTADPLDEAAWRALMTAQVAAGARAAPWPPTSSSARPSPTSSAPTPPPRPRPSTWPSSAAPPPRRPRSPGRPRSPRRPRAPRRPQARPTRAHPRRARPAPTPGAPDPRPPVLGAPTGRVAQPRKSRIGLSTAPPREGGAAPPRGGGAAQARGGSVQSSAAAPADGGFVGRERELGDLAAAWAGAVGGRPGLVLIAGEAGIGKTRLAQAVAELAGATGGMVVQARCYEAERSQFLQPLAEAVRAAALALPPDLRPAFLERGQLVIAPAH